MAKTATRKYTRQQLLDTIVEARRQKGADLTTTDFVQRNFGLFTLGPYMKEFGNIKGVNAAGRNVEAGMSMMIKDREAKQPTADDLHELLDSNASDESVEPESRSIAVKVSRSGAHAELVSSDPHNMIRMFRLTGNEDTAALIEKVVDMHDEHGVDETSVAVKVGESLLEVTIG